MTGAHRARRTGPSSASFTWSCLPWICLLGGCETAAVRFEPVPGEASGGGASAGDSGLPQTDSGGANDSGGDSGGGANDSGDSGGADSGEDTDPPEPWAVSGSTDDEALGADGLAWTTDLDGAALLVVASPSADEGRGSVALFDPTAEALAWSGAEAAWSGREGDGLGGALLPWAPAEGERFALLAGAPDADFASWYGESYVYEDVGRVVYLSWPAPTDAPSIIGYSINDAFGAALAGGDLNGDGRADLAVAAPGSWESRGRVYLFDADQVGEDLLAAEADGSITGDAPGDAAGTTLSISPDLDLDGYAELIVCSPGADSGLCAVVPGDAELSGFDDSLDERATTLIVGGVGGGLGLEAALVTVDATGDGTLDLLLGDSVIGEIARFDGPLAAGTASWSDAPARITGSPGLGGALLVDPATDTLWAGAPADGEGKVWSSPLPLADGLHAAGLDEDLSSWTGEGPGFGAGLALQGDQLAVGAPGADEGRGQVTLLPTGP